MDHVVVVGTGLADPRRAPGRLSGTLRSPLVRPRDLVLEPFLAGVVLEDEGRTSGAFVRDLVGWFLQGTAGLPAGGMGPCPPGSTTGCAPPAVLGVRVRSVEREGTGWTVRAARLPRGARLPGEKAVRRQLGRSGGRAPPRGTC
ncbi:hypothetical protein ACH9EU_13665 [Kocuria sp. M1R5S2]|uniref:hypothetical protein n=1 Tax=Kocuria rhizosphaerae TaxID=3376285 RepID=UPI0037AED144